VVCPASMHRLVPRVTTLPANRSSARCTTIQSSYSVSSDPTPTPPERMTATISLSSQPESSAESNAPAAPVACGRRAAGTMTPALVPPTTHAGALARDLPETTLRATSPRPTIQPSAAPLTCAVMRAREAVDGVVNYPSINGMQGVRGSNPLSSTPGQRASTAGIPPDSPPSCSRFAANAERDPVRAASATSSRLVLPLGRNARRDRAASSTARVTRASIAGVSPIDPPNGLRAEARSRWPPEWPISGRAGSVPASSDSPWPPAHRAPSRCRPPPCCLPPPLAPAIAPLVHRSPRTIFGSSVERTAKLHPLWRARRGTCSWLPVTIGMGGGRPGEVVHLWMTFGCRLWVYGVVACGWMWRMLGGGSVRS
jgi:hypothetical protein